MFVEGELAVDSPNCVLHYTGSGELECHRVLVAAVYSKCAPTLHASNLRSGSIDFRLFKFCCYDQDRFVLSKAVY